MKISIITVCYNSEKTIRDTIESVVNQKYSNIEYIIVDGNSSDQTMSIVNEYADYISKVVSEPDSGIYDAMNKGIRMATGDVVGILNSDDFFTSTNSVQHIVNGFSDEKVDAVYGDLIYVEQTNTKKITRFYSVSKLSTIRIKMGLMIPHPTFYVKRHLFQQFGFYKTDYRVSADFELMARFHLQGMRLSKVNHVIVSMREGGISSVGFRWMIHQNQEIVRACRENGVYTNLAMVCLKIPIKIISRIKRPLKTVTGAN